MHATATCWMANAAEVTGVIPGLVASRRYVPAALIVRFANDATPLTVVTVSVPPRMPGPEPGVSATVTGTDAPVTIAPEPSTTATATGGPAGLKSLPVIGSPIRASWGSVTKRRLLQPPETVVVSALFCV